MLERIRRLRKDEKGFTLIELIMVLVILGILLALALPSYLGTRRKAYIPEADQRLQEWATQQWLHYVEKNTFTDDTAVVALPSDTDNWTFHYGRCDATSCTASAVGRSAVAGALIEYTIHSNGSRVISSSGF